ncbi:Serine/threonine-protein kinase PknI [Pseudomonas sp. 31 R 17]|uniref:serine/threonine protein kinase n=1 Tax=Pseudomonas TaxID=286 RepID=UPI0008129A4A|nr:MULTISPECIES: protein kinase [Pseudomonas]CRM53497.1 Serine/threonine-protein kinase PknI [Pseudomonas sp. 31 R 17]
MDVRTLEGAVFRGWAVKNSIGAGADGIVYLVEKNDELRALKLFYPEIISKNGLEEQLERLDLQLALIGEKHQRNLVEIFEGGYLEDHNTIYLFMEYVPGVSLDRLVGKIPAHSVFPLISQLADAAEFLEQRNLFHRDIKPANIVVSEDFTHLCLLDLGIIHQSPDVTDDDRRISGEDFVASLRYSPPEFVWREEVSSDTNAWRAITFYQIGATLYEMIAGKNIFSGMDSPRARLYDCVKYKTPTFDFVDVDAWIANLARACLVKSWRERLLLVSWESFKGPPSILNLGDMRTSIRLKQIHVEEAQKLSQHTATPHENNISLLWNLQEEIFSEIRSFLMAETIFPRFRSNQHPISNSEYQLEFIFELDPARAFNERLKFSINLKCENDTQHSLLIGVSATTDTASLVEGLWTESMSTELACNICVRSFYAAAEKIISSN